VLKLLSEKFTNSPAQVIYVQETFQVLPACPSKLCLNCTPDRNSELGINVFENVQTKEVQGHHLVRLRADESNLLSNQSQNGGKSKTYLHDKGITEKTAESKVKPDKSCSNIVDNFINQAEPKMSEEVNKSVIVDIDTQCQTYLRFFRRTPETRV
jgi:hypothetical protein